LKKLCRGERQEKLIFERKIQRDTIYGVTKGDIR
jgi:hypothetical protein